MKKYIVIFIVMPFMMGAFNQFNKMWRTKTPEEIQQILAQLKTQPPYFV